MAVSNKEMVALAGGIRPGFGPEFGLDLLQRMTDGRAGPA